MDKAGSYGIQSIASSFVHKLNGCYFNVVGFPIHRFTKELLLMLKEKKNFVIKSFFFLYLNKLYNSF